MTVFNNIKNDFFGVCIPLAYYFCMMPTDTLQNRSKNFKKCYNIYAGMIYSLALFCHASQLIKLYQILTDETFIFDELIRNYIITSYHFTALVKCVFLRGQLSAKIFGKIIKYEERIYESKNEQLKSVYKSTLFSVKNTKSYYLFGIILVVIFYIAAPAFRDPYYVQKGNETIVILQMPLSSWTLVDDNYWYAFVWTSAAGAYLTVFFTTTDLICYSFFSFIVFATCQCEVLQYFIHNFYKFSQDIKNQNRCSEAESFKILHGECIMMHQDIIRFVRSLNASLKKIMILDFFPGSIQLAGMIFQMMTNLSVVQCILLGEFVCTLIARIFIYCNSSQHLANESQRIADSWYEIDWIELPSEIKKNMVLCIARAQKPLTITIGDFQAISVTTFLAILKGTYSYMMLLTTL